MKERPIPMSAPMVRALLAGTQTRRAALQLALEATPEQLSAAMAGVYAALPEWDIRGVLASLKCWHRLTEEEAADLVEFARRHGIGTANPAHGVGS